MVQHPSLMIYYYCDNCKYETYQEEIYCPDCKNEMILLSDAIESKYLNEVIEHE
jgi:predicted Zn-ribbon and HTH transcriptional regulator